MTIPEWRDLEASQSLDEMICKIVGWSVTMDPLNGTATLRTPDLKIVNTWGSNEAWPNVAQIAWNNAPRYSRNTDDALSLFNETAHYQISLIRLDGEWSCQINTISSRLREHGDGRASSPALAVCRAYLDWLERQPSALRDSKGGAE